MGYDLHVTRAEAWPKSEDNPITAEEWLAVVRDDPELALAGYNGPYFALWDGPSEYPDPWFDWSHGEIYTKNPDVPMIRKMIGLAERLNARVQGDDGEEYPSPFEDDPYWLSHIPSDL
jgi:hypothetical protein